MNKLLPSFFSSSLLRALFMLSASVFLLPAQAQHAHEHGHHASHSHRPSSPYAGMQERTIKALSPQQLADLMEGRGMGYALAAELNAYPGPMHVLEWEEALALSDEQKAATRRVFMQMQASAKSLGEQLIDDEAALDKLFRERRATPQAVTDATLKAALSQGKLRNVHLQAHLEMMDILTPDQQARYQQLRGYGKRQASEKSDQ